MIYDNTLPQTLQVLTAKWLKRSVLCSVLLDEPSSLGGLPQQTSVVVRILLSLTLRGGHSGNWAPVNTAESNEIQHEDRVRKHRMGTEMKRWMFRRKISYCLLSSANIHHVRGLSEAAAGQDGRTDEMCTWICRLGPTRMWNASGAFLSSSTSKMLLTYSRHAR